MNYISFRQAGVVLLIAMLSVVAVSRVSSAAPEPKQLSLYDANNTFLGYIVDAHDSTTYITYLPSIDAFLTLRSQGYGSPDQFFITLAGGSPIYYDSPGCVGNSYLLGNTSSIVDVSPQWVVASPVSHPTDAVRTFTGLAMNAWVDVTALSSFTNGTCTNEFLESPGVQITPVTLPFNPQSLDFPLSIAG